MEEREKPTNQAKTVELVGLWRGRVSLNRRKFGKRPTKRQEYND